jgi:hypothetical protein
MKRSVILCWCVSACCVLALAVSGCGSNGDALVKEQIQLINDLATAMESDAPQAKMDALQERGKQLNKRFEALNLSDADKKQLLQRHQADLQKAATRLTSAMMAKTAKGIGGGIPGFPPMGGGK